MKEPWEIYFDELQIELNRLRKVEGEDSSDDGLDEAIKNTQKAVLSHLTQVEMWLRDEAIGLLKHLEKEGVRRAPDLGLRESLRHAWTDWKLKRGK